MERVFGNWIVKEKIGEGAFGTVYRLEREDFGVLYQSALKKITIPPTDKEIEDAISEGMDQDSVSTYFKSFVEEIVNEFALMAKLKGHTNIVNYEDHLVEPHADGIGYDVLIRMELLTSLQEMQKNNSLSREDVIKLGIDICTALEVCQQYQIIHRDIKPENIFVSELGDYKLGDFGIARTIEKTMSGLSKKGTYTYMAPEIYRGEKYGSNVDIYSLGIVMYRLMNNNRAPFLPSFPSPITYADREKAMTRRMSGEKVPHPCNADNELNAIIEKACAFKPEDRYSNPSDMKNDLVKLAGHCKEKTVMELDEEKTEVLWENARQVEDFIKEKSDGSVNPSENDTDEKTSIIQQADNRKSTIIIQKRGILIACLVGIIAGLGILWFIIGNMNKGVKEGGDKGVMANENTMQNEVISEPVNENKPASIEESSENDLSSESTDENEIIAEDPDIKKDDVLTWTEVENASKEWKDAIPAEKYSEPLSSLLKNYGIMNERKKRSDGSNNTITYYSIGDVDNDGMPEIFYLKYDLDDRSRSKCDITYVNGNESTASRGGLPGEMIYFSSEINTFYTLSTTDHNYKLYRCWYDQEKGQGFQYTLQYYLDLDSDVFPIIEQIAGCKEGIYEPDHYYTDDMTGIENEFGFKNDEVNMDCYADYKFMLDGDSVIVRAKPNNSEEIGAISDSNKVYEIHNSVIDDEGIRWYEYYFENENIWGFVRSDKVELIWKKDSHADMGNLFGKYVSESERFVFDFRSDGTCILYQDNIAFEGNYERTIIGWKIDMLGDGTYFDTSFDAQKDGEKLRITGGIINGELFEKTES